MRARMCAVASAAALLVTITACDAGAGEWSESNYSVQGALAQIPATGVEGEVMIQTADLDAASTLSDLERPTELDNDALFPWLMPLTGGPSDGGPAPVFVPLAQVFNPQSIAFHDEFADELGWSLLETTMFVERVSPPQNLAVVLGNFGDDALAGDLTDVADGVVTAGEGEDFQVDLTNATNARPTGAPLRLAQNGDLIAAGGSTDEVAQWLAGPEHTLADDPHLAGVASALDDADSVSALLVTGSSFALAGALGGQFSPDQLAAAEDQMSGVLPGDPFYAVGIGWSVDDGDSVITVAYSFDSDGAAEAAVPRFEELFASGSLIQSGAPLSEQLTLEGASHDGPLVTLSLSVPEGRSPAEIYQLLVARDVPFLHR